MNMEKAQPSSRKYYYPADMAKTERGHARIHLMMEKLQSGEADIDGIGSEDDKTPLMIAAEVGSCELLTCLIDRKANLNIQNKDGDTALLVAASNNQHNFLQILLDHGADPNVCDKDGCAPLHVAAKNGFLDIVVSLICANSVGMGRSDVVAPNINIKDNEKSTPLIYAAMHGRTEIVRTLLRWNAETHCVNKNGDTAQTLARELGHTEIEHILEDHFALGARRTMFISSHNDDAGIRCIRLNISAEQSYFVNALHTSGTISVRYNDIPRYLHDSEFYKSLNSDEDDSAMELPARYYKKDDTVDNVDDFTLLIQVASYWGLCTVPAGIIQFCFENDIFCWEQYVGGTIFGADLKYIFSRDSQCLYRAIEREYQEAVDYLLAYGSNDLDSTLEITISSKLGRLDYIERLHNAGFAWNVDACASAAENGHVQCLNYLHDHGCDWDYNVYTGAILYGHMECIEYAFAQGLEWDSDLYEVAMANGNIEYIEFLHTHGCPWSDCVTTEAAQSGRVDCLLYALDNDCPVSKIASTKAAAGGHIRCLQLLHVVGAEWDASAPKEAAQHGHLNCLIYLHEHGCPWNESTTEAAVRFHHVQLLRYAIENSCPYDESLLLVAAKCGSTWCLRFLIEDRCMYMDMDGSLFGAAFERGQMNTLRYLFESGCPFCSYKFKYDTEKLQHINDPNFDEQFLVCILLSIERGAPIVNEELIDFIFHNNLPLCQLHMVREGYSGHYDTEHLSGILL